MEAGALGYSEFSALSLPELHQERYLGRSQGCFPGDYSEVQGPMVICKEKADFLCHSTHLVITDSFDLSFCLQDAIALTMPGSCVHHRQLYLQTLCQ